MIEAIFDIVPGALYLYDDQGNPVRWNRQIAAITGFSQAELSRMKLLDWFEGDAESISGLPANWRKCFGTDPPRWRQICGLGTDHGFPSRCRRFPC